MTASEIILAFVTILFLVFAGGFSIMAAVHSFIHRKYFWFGVDVMWAVTDACLIITRLIGLYL